MSRPGPAARLSAVLPRLGMAVVLLLVAGAFGSVAAAAGGAAFPVAGPARWAQPATTPPGPDMPALGGGAGQEGQVGSGGQQDEQADEGIPGGDVPAGLRPGSETRTVADEGGGGLGLLMLGLAVVAAIGAGVLLAASRRRPAAAAAGVASGRARIAWGTPGTPGPQATGPVATTGGTTAAAGRTVADAVRDAQQLEVLTAALREVAVHGPSDAIRQQVERLLNGSRVRREDLVDSCVRYRDQLAERDPALAGHLLGALAQVGVTELVADGEGFDPHRHQSMDVQDTPYAYLRDVVAATTRPGYLDNGRVLRLPEVIVYRFVPGRGEQPWNPAQ